MSRLNLRNYSFATQAIWCAFLLAFSANGATYTVKAGGGGNYTTIGNCAAAMAGGDTCVVYAGTYNETPTIPAGTGSGTYNTITVNGSDVVTVYGFTLNSHTKLIGNCTAPASAGSCGFSIQNPSSPSSAACVELPNSTTDVYIRNNVMTECGSGALIEGGYPSSISYIYIQGNTLSYGCVQSGVVVSTTGSFAANANSMTVASVGGAKDGWVVYGTGLNVSNGVLISSISGTTLNLMTVTGGDAALDAETNSPITLAPPVCNSIDAEGSHFLVENNDLSHYTLSIDAVTEYSIYRNNTFHDVYQYEGGGNTHTDSWFSEPGVSTYPAEYNVIEGNSLRNTNGPDAKGILAQADTACGGVCFNLIERFNVASRLGGAYNSNNGTATWGHLKIYNNTIADPALDGSVSGQGDIDNSEKTTNGSFLNQLYYLTGPSNLSSFNMYACSNDGTNPPSTAMCTSGHSIYYCSGITCSSVYGQTYEVGTWLGEAGNLVSNPSFVNYVSQGNSANNYHLQSGSPAIAAGTYLTTVASGDSGSGTSLVVNDASYFQDGYGLSNAYSTVSPDCIAVNTASNYVCVTAVNYSTNTLTLASSISRSAGQGVYLYSKSDGVQVLTGSAPDLGAYPYGSGGVTTTSPPPSSLAIVAQ